jgi:HK97 family phage portal protein
LSIFTRIKQFLLTPIRNLGVTDPRAWDRQLWSFHGHQSLSGEIVNEYTALTYSAVFNAVSLISGTIGALPLHLMQKKGDKKRIADDRILYRVMHDEFNPYMSAKGGREVLMAHVLLWGNGYAEKVTNGFGEVIQLWPITPDRVTPEMRAGAMVYKIRIPDGQDVYLPREKILHVPGLGFDGFMGYSVVAMARKSFGLGMGLETFGSLYFGQGTHPGMIVTHPGKLGAEGHKNLKDALTQNYSGLGNSHRLMLLEDGMKPEKIGIPPNDSQFIESRAFQVAEIARWFGLPPHKLKDLSKSSFNNIEQEQISFVQDSILPWVVTLEQSYNMQLLSKSDKELSGRGSLYFKHSLEGKMRGDSQSRGRFYQLLFGVGALSSNDIRALEDLDPIEGGDKYFVPLNMVPLDMVEELLTKRNEPPPAALPPVDDTPEEEDPQGKDLPESEKDKGDSNEAVVQDRE